MDINIRTICGLKVREKERGTGITKEKYGERGRDRDKENKKENEIEGEREK